MIKTFIAHKISLLFRGHPKVLPFLFFAEFWERFSFYGMRSLLILYLTEKFLFDDRKACEFVGSYVALIYISPLIAGFIADRYLGYRQAIIFGSIIMAIGQFMLIFSGLNMLYYGLAFTCWGAGFFKANISAFLGQFYAQNDPARDGGFTLFYMGINLGALCAPFVCGLLVREFGWSYAFMATGMGILFGMMVFLSGKKLFGVHGLSPCAESMKKTILMIPFQYWIYIFILMVMPPLYTYLLMHPKQMNWFMLFVGAMTIFMIIYYAVRSEDQMERKNLIVFMVLIVFFMFFWAFAEQMGSSLLLFAARHVHRVLFGWEIPTPWFYSLNPIFIVLFSPIFAWLWVRMGKANPYTAFKFFLGLFLLGLGFVVVGYGTRFHTDGQTSSFWLVMCIFLYTLGELCLSPVALSMVTKLVPKSMMGMMMGVLFIGIAGGGFLAGKIAHYILPTTKNPLLSYGESFYTIGMSALGISLILLLLVPLFRPVLKESDGS